MGTHPDFRRLERIERIAGRMDKAFRLPFTGIRLGWDSILGLVPGIGDTLAVAPALWIVKEAHSLGAPKSLLSQMGGHLAIDYVIGLIPLIGDVFDVGFKANTRNAALLRQWLELRHQPVGTSPAGTPRVAA